MPVVAVTGNLCSGKTTVIKLLKGKIKGEFRADELVHTYYKDKTGSIYKKVKKYFPDALNTSGNISRKKLGQIVFASSHKLRKLESIVHPRIIKDLEAWTTEKHKRKGIYLAEVPLLFEKKLNKLFDAVIFVDAPELTIINRATRKFKISQEETKTRIANFMPADVNKKRSDFVICNGSSIRKLKEGVDVIWQKLKKM